MILNTIILVVLGLLLIYIIFSIVRIVPTQKAFVVERLGKYNKTLEAGFNVLAPFIDKVAYKQSLKERAVDVPPQTCITKDNISVSIDGILFYRIVDPVKASYGIDDHSFAINQIAQTTMRSEIGSIELDVTFESRDNINSAIVAAVDEASDPWGIKVTRYEIKNIETPRTIRDAMEKQMRAEREKREQIALSEGDKLAKINRAEGIKEEAIKISEGERIKRENEARGQATAILEIAKATALGIDEVSKAVNQPGGSEALSMKIAGDWFKSFEKLAKETNTMIIPTNMTEIASVSAVLKSALNFTKPPVELKK
ncbi:MAG: SPFH domain-containing protein [Spirochaetaceae bacterium]